jgi:hypothetical protein
MSKARGVPLADLEATCRSIGRTIAGVLPDGAGFTLVLFDFGADGNMTYLSNAQRADMVRMLEELIEKLRQSRGSVQ